MFAMMLQIEIKLNSVILAFFFMTESPWLHGEPLPEIGLYTVSSQTPMKNRISHCGGNHLLPLLLPNACVEYNAQSH